MRKVRNKETAIEVQSVHDMRKLNSIVERQSQETNLMYKTNYSELYETTHLSVNEVLPARVASSGTQTMTSNQCNSFSDSEKKTPHNDSSSITPIKTETDLCLAILSKMKKNHEPLLVPSNRS